MEGNNMTPVSLPLDLIVHKIFSRLPATSVVCCAAVCRSWRRIIIGNASRLRPHSDRFVPNLLLAFIDGRDVGRVQHVLGPFQSALQMTRVAASYLYPLQPAAHGVDLGSYRKLLSSRDGFLLLGNEHVSERASSSPYRTGRKSSCRRPTS